MFRNYLKIAVRSLLRNKILSIINMAGLAIGISACLLITMYVLDELSYDRFHEKSDRIYRLTTITHLPNEDRAQAMSAPSMGQWLKENFPEVESTVRLGTSRRPLSFEKVQVPNTEIWYADSTLFDIFSFTLIKGNPKKALVEPYSIVLTESAAKRYFGTNDPFGKSMMFSDTIPLKVTGIIKDIPANSHIHMDVIVSRSSVPAMTGDLTYDKEWFLSVIYTYVLLNETNNPKTLEAKIKPVIAKHNADEQRTRKVNITHDIQLQPITDIHLKSHLHGEIGVNGHSTYVYLFLVVAILVLLIACANYVNLSTARSLRRAKEIGMRKVIGAKRQQLVTQLLGESLLITLASFILAVMIISFSIHSFNTFSGKSLTFDLISDTRLLWITMSTFLVVSLLAGCYPAFFLSSFSPIKVLRNKLASSGQNAFIRQSLVVFQFTISIVLIISTLVISRQMNFIQNRNLGLNKDQIIELKLRLPVLHQRDIIKNEILKISGVTAATANNFSYSKRLTNSPVRPEGAEKDDYSTENIICADHDFLKTFGIMLESGRDFSKNFYTDEIEAVIINESAVKHFNWGSPEQAIDKSIFLPMYGRTSKVIGVVKDFNCSSLHENIKPIIIQISPDYQFLAVKISAKTIPVAIDQMKKVWNSLPLNSPFEYSFMDEDFAHLYHAEQQTQSIIAILSGLAIFIACLGLFGLASFMTEQRMKEISIRKILGADVLGITSLLTKDFIRLVLVSIVLSAPIAWFALTGWLESFAYKTNVPIWIFLAAGCCSVLIAIFTVSFQSIKAAIANPIDSLRSE